jgi:CDGSH-type Zn-finger protein
VSTPVNDVPSFEHPDVVLCPGGPLLLRGEQVVEGDDGSVHRTTRPVSAVCRCGKSASRPWCDGTHKLLPEGSRP